MRQKALIPDHPRYQKVILYVPETDDVFAFFYDTVDDEPAVQEAWYPTFGAAKQGLFQAYGIGLEAWEPIHQVIPGTAPDLEKAMQPITLKDGGMLLVPLEALKRWHEAEKLLQLLDEAMLQEIQELTQTYNIIIGIKRYRELTHQGLRESKLAVHILQGCKQRPESSYRPHDS